MLPYVCGDRCPHNTATVEHCERETGADVWRVPSLAGFTVVSTAAGRHLVLLSLMDHDQEPVTPCHMVNFSSMYSTSRRKRSKDNTTYVYSGIFVMTVITEGLLNN